jgi:hypothetical protein
VKYVRKIAICFAGGLALSAAVHAENVVSQNNPYAPIVVRNIFGLNPPQPVVQADPNPPPKIIANGIMTIFGNRQALFKVAEPAKTGQPARTTSHILGEGQRQDDIEVTHIDEKSGTITFNNHGTVQEIPLTTAPAIAMPASFAANPTPAFAFTPQANMNAGGVTRIGSGTRFRRTGSTGNINAGNFNGTYGGSAPTQNENLSPEAQILMIEANRAATQEQVNEGKMPPLPPTALTPQDATAAGGTPLIAPPPVPGQ